MSWRRMAICAALALFGWLAALKALSLLGWTYGLTLGMQRTPISVVLVCRPRASAPDAGC